MKNQIIRQLVLVVFALTTMIACDNDRIEMEPEQIDGKALPSESILVEIAHQKYLSIEVETGPIEGTFFIENDGLIDEYTATEKDFTAVDKQTGNTFLLCLRSAELEPEQRQKVGRILHNYRTRNEGIIVNHRQLVRQLHERMQTARKTLHMQYRNDRITEDEFHARLAAMRERYQEGLQRIRTSNAKAFSRSYAFLLERLQDVLTEEQWEGFADCLDA